MRCSYGFERHYKNRTRDLLYMGNEKEWKMTEVFSFNDGINDDGFARR